MVQELTKAVRQLPFIIESKREAEDRAVRKFEVSREKGERDSCGTGAFLPFLNILTLPVYVNIIMLHCEGRAGVSQKNQLFQSQQPGLVPNFTEILQFSTESIYNIPTEETTTAEGTQVQESGVCM